MPSRSSVKWTWKCLRLLDQVHNWYSLRFKRKVTFGHQLRYEIKVTFWWNISQTSPNEVECCQKQCKCCCWWTTKSNNSSHSFNNWYLDLTVSMHINPVLCALVPSAQIGKASSEMDAKNFQPYYGHPSLARKLLVRAMQHTQFCAKSVRKWP